MSVHINEAAHVTVQIDAPYDAEAGLATVLPSPALELPQGRQRWK